MKYAEITKRFRQFFELPHTPVAVKINSETPADTDLQPMRYCEMVRKSAAHGDTFTFTVDDLSCASAELALGFTEPTYGKVYPTITPANTTQVTVAPLDKCEFDPDVVVIIGNAAKLMRIATILSRVQGNIISSKFKGEFAVCGECTAIPLMENTVNLSLLCGGARMFGGYRSDEIVFGFPMDTFVKLTEALTEDSIIKALCGCIMDDLPASVVDAIMSLGFSKGTDHFSGRFGDEIVRLYIPKSDDGKSISISLHVPVKFKDADAATNANEVASGLFEEPMFHRTRDNWVDVVLLVELGESINRAAMRGEKFNALVKGGIDVMLEHIGKFRRKAGQ